MTKQSPEYFDTLGNVAMANGLVLKALAYFRAADAARRSPR